ncbi:MAG: hypothetical protein U9N36_01810 [Euryarchaeota archaeon]|nr:hypothetical protein [Euryarchaeota archaeon]
MQELSKTWNILQPTGNLTAECAEGRRGAQRENKRLSAPRSSAPSAVIFLARRYRIAIGRPINIPE